MDHTLAPLIPELHTLRDALVDHARLADELEALHPHCFGWTFTCCDRKREDAEDVLHDVYVMVLDGRARFDNRSTFKTWLFGVIHRTATSHRRRARLHVLLGIRAMTRTDGPASRVSPDEATLAHDRAHETQVALLQLSARQREVLQLVFYHDLTIEEASVVMQVSLGSARTHYARGKTRMAELLAQHRS